MSATCPCNHKKFYIYSDGTHTHKPCRSRVDDMKTKMDANEHEMTNYLTETRDGERKKGREKGRTPTPTHLAQNGQTLKGKGKEKADGRRAKHRPEEGGADGSA